MKKRTFQTILLLALMFLPILAMASGTGDSQLTKFTQTPNGDGWNNYVNNGITLLFYVDTPDMVHLYENIFNAIGMIFRHSSGYVELIKFVFILGGFIAFFSGLFKSIGAGGTGDGAISGYFKYLFTALFLILLVTARWNTQIIIKSHTFDNVCSSAGSTSPMGVSPAYGRDVPSAIALGYFAVHKVGEALTEFAEKAFTTPTSGGWYRFEKMTNNGGYVGAIRDSLRVLSIDPSQVSLMSQYTAPDGTVKTFNRDANTTGIVYDMSKMAKSLFKDCILVPFSAKGKDGEGKLNELKSSSDIWKWLDDLYTNNDAVGGIKAKDYTMTYMGEEYKCGDFYTNYFKPAVEQFGADAGCGYQVGKGAVALITGAGPGTGPTSNFSQVAIQSGMVGVLQDTMSDLGIGISGVSYASGKTRAEFAMTNMASGQYMAEMLPILQMTIRAVLYAFFPFVFVVIMFPGGIKVLSNYIVSLLWVELWTPVAAILNMILSIYTGNKYQAMYNSAGLTTQNAVDFLTTGSTIAGVAGYLYLMVPALTWLILKGSAHMLTGIGAGMAAGMSQNIRTESINRDAASIAKANEATAVSGEAIGIAEMQHYEAVQQGRIEGSKLGLDMKTGMDGIVAMNTAEHASKIQSYKTTSKLTGLSGEGLGIQEGRFSAFNRAQNAMFGAKTSDSILRGAAVSLSNLKAGETAAQADHQYSTKDGYGKGQNDIGKTKGDADVGHRFGVRTIAKATANKGAYDVGYGLGVDFGVGATAAEKTKWDQLVYKDTVEILQEHYGTKDKAADAVAESSVGSTIKGSASYKALQDVTNFLNQGRDKDHQLSVTQVAKMIEHGRQTFTTVDKDGNVSTYYFTDKNGQIALSKTVMSPEKLVTFTGAVPYEAQSLLVNKLQAEGVDAKSINKALGTQAQIANIYRDSASLSRVVSKAGVSMNKLGSILGVVGTSASIASTIASSPAMAEAVASYVAYKKAGGKEDMGEFVTESFDYFKKKMEVPSSNGEGSSKSPANNNTNQPTNGNPNTDVSHRVKTDHPTPPPTTDENKK